MSRRQDKDRYGELWELDEVEAVGETAEKATNQIHSSGRPHLGVISGARGAACSRRRRDIP